MKIGRNAPCPCGSGKKYKICCLNKTTEIDLKGVDKEVFDAAILSLEQNEKAVKDSISKLQDILKREDLTSKQIFDAKRFIAQAYQRRGNHNSAIEIVNSIISENNNDINQFGEVEIKKIAAVSFIALGDYDGACKLFDEILLYDKKNALEPKMKAGILLEAGKAYSLNNNDDKAREFWNESLQIFEKENDVEHYARALANIGFLRLKNKDEKKQEEGLQLIEDSSEIKRRIGDIEGLANNYSNLRILLPQKKKIWPRYLIIQKRTFIMYKDRRLKSNCNYIQQFCFLVL